MKKGVIIFIIFTVIAFAGLTHADQEVILSDGTWKSYDQSVAGWELPGFNDASWRFAFEDYPPFQPKLGAALIWDWPGSGNPNGIDGPVNAYFRKTFDLTFIPDSAKAYLDVDDDFTLYVNGIKVESNQDLTASGLWGYDIAPYLVTGQNLIAIHATDSYGIYEHLEFLAIISKDQAFLNKKTRLTFFHDDDFDKDRSVFTGYLKESLPALPFNSDVTVTVLVPDPFKLYNNFMIFEEKIPAGVNMRTKYRYKSRNPGIKELIFDQRSDSTYVSVQIDKVNFLESIRNSLTFPGEYLQFIKSIYSFTIIIRIDSAPDVVEIWSGTFPLKHCGLTSTKLNLCWWGTKVPTATADLSIQKTAPAIVPPNWPFFYNFIVRNLGPNDITEVQVVDMFPAGIFPTRSGPPGCDTSGRIFRCKIKNLKANDVRSFNLRVHTDNYRPITNKALVIPLTGSDPNLGNNTASTTVH